MTCLESKSSNVKKETVSNESENCLQIKEVKGVVFLGWYSVVLVTGGTKEGKVTTVVDDEVDDYS